MRQAHGEYLRNPDREACLEDGHESKSFLTRFVGGEEIHKKYPDRHQNTIYMSIKLNLGQQIFGMT